MSKEKLRINPDTLKLYTSSHYRGQIKRMVERIKMLRGIHWGTKLPGKPNTLGSNASEKEKEKHAKNVAYRADKDTAHYWAQPVEFSFERRIATSTRTDEE